MTTGAPGEEPAGHRLPSPEELVSFLDGLRLQGWRIDPRQMTACCRILARARAEGDDGVWSERLPYRLTPVIAAKPHEQAEFRKRFAVEFSRGPAQVREVELDDQPVLEDGTRAPFYQHSWFIGAVAATLVAGLGLVAIGLAPPPPEVEDAPPSPVVEEPSPEAVPQPEETIEVAPRVETVIRSIPSPYGPALATLATSAPFILLLGWLAWRWGHRLLWLAPGAVPPDVGLSKLHLPASVTRALFTSMSFRASAQDLRRHRPVLSADIDVDRSIDATVANAGFFTAVPWRRPQLPEYVFLIERLASNDHLARLFELAVRRLRHEGVIISTYYYHEDPRHLTPADRPAAQTDLRELAGRTDEYRLIVIGTADGFFHPISGDTHRWIHEFEPWSSRTMLSTRPIDEWTRSELQLLDEGFSLATARSSGLTRVAERVSHGIDDEPSLLEGVIVAPPPARARAREAGEEVDTGALIARVRDLRARAEADPEAAPHLDDLRTVEAMVAADATASDALRAALERLSRVRSPAWLAAPRLWNDVPRLRGRSLADGAATRSETQELALRVITDTVPEDDRERRLRSGELVIGHSRSAGWNLPDPDGRMARAHCVIEFGDGAARLRNLSTGGVFVDDARSAVGFGMDAELRDGMKLMIGPHTISVALTSSPDRSPARRTGAAAGSTAWFTKRERKPLYATGLGNALRIDEKSIAECAAQMGRSIEQVERWTLYRDKVTVEMQDRLATWLERNIEELFSDRRPKDEFVGKPMWATGLKSALESRDQRLDIRGLADLLLEEDVDRVRKWVELKLQVTPTVQRQMVDVLEVPHHRLFDLEYQSRAAWAVGLREAMREHRLTTRRLAQMIDLADPARLNRWKELEELVPARWQNDLVEKLDRSHGDLFEFGELADDTMRFARSLQDVMAARGVTSEDLARQLDVELERVGAWIRREKLVATATRRSIAAFLAVDESELFSDQRAELPPAAVSDARVDVLDVPHHRIFDQDYKEGSAWAVGLREAMREKHQTTHRLARRLELADPARLQRWKELEELVPARWQDDLVKKLDRSHDDLFDFGELADGTMRFARRLQDVMAARGVSSEDLARKLDVELERVGAWIRHEKPVARATRRSLAIVLDVDESQLFGGEVAELDTNSDVRDRP